MLTRWRRLALVAAASAIAIYGVFTAAAIVPDSGVGIAEDESTVSEILPGSPVWRDGIREGDVVIALRQGSSPEGWLLTARGPEGDHLSSARSHIATLRSDPWGNLLASTGALPDWRFQGSWHDTTTGLAWSVARWYDPAQGTFTSEDSLLGDPGSPASRHLYAYAEGDPVGGWDPVGTQAIEIKRHPVRGRTTSGRITPAHSRRR